MDPFLEGQLWSDFHADFIPEIRARLVPRLAPDYVVNVEKTVYLLHDNDEVERLVIPDVAVIESGNWTGGVDLPEGGVAVAAVVRTLPQIKTVRHSYLVIRSRHGRDVVTVIELLSPWNKSGEGRGEYLQKRDALLASPVNLVELDLLRGGPPLPTVERLPRGDLFAFVSRGTQRPETDVYAWSLRRVLPSIPIPLAPGDADVSLELQLAFDETYDRAGYRYSVDYNATLEPPLSNQDAAWVCQLLERPKAP
jgi:hypothetical protein